MSSPLTSTSSDSEEFYDAEDNTPNRTGTLKRQSDTRSRDTFRSLTSEPDLQKLTKSDDNDDDVFVVPAPPEPVPLERKPSSHGSHGSNSTSSSRQNQQKFQELRTKMQTEDEEVVGGGASPPDSQTSSIEGVYAADGSSHKTSHPFKIIEHDALSLQSMTSLGRVGRLLSGLSDTGGVGGVSSQMKENSGSTSTLKSASHGDLVRLLAPPKEPSTAPPSTTSSPVKEKLTAVLQEPDVIASTKPSENNSNSNHTNIQPPVAPPRRKKKMKPQQNKLQEEPYIPTSSQVDNATTPVNNVDLAHSIALHINRANTKDGDIKTTSAIKGTLDIKSAIKGQYVVKPQDLERVKALMYRNTHPLPSTSKAQDNVSSLPRIFHPEHVLSGVSTYPLTSSTHNINTRARLGLSPPSTSRERRRSAGDETGLLQQSLNMFVRTRTDSGKPLSDMEILEQVTVLNLDTGERVPLSIAEDKLPQCINPLSLHIMRITSEYVSNPTLEKEKESDEESVDSKLFESIPDDTEDYQDTNSGGVRRKAAQVKRFLGSTVKNWTEKVTDKAKNIAHRHKEDVMDLVDEVNPQGEGIKLKASNSHKGPFDFESLQHVQELNSQHIGPVWCMKFSVCGRLLATAGQDRVLR
ncbi:hypothetical protein WDU94_004896, partial [Cyamophila willieti]